MNSQRVSADPITKRPDEVLNVKVDFSLFGLEPTETIEEADAEVLGVEEDDDEGVEVDDIEVNSEPFKNRAGGTCAAERGVLFSAAGGVSGTTYEVALTATTSEGQVLSPIITIEVVDR